MFFLYNRCICAIFGDFCRSISRIVCIFPIFMAGLWLLALPHVGVLILLRDVFVSFTSRCRVVYVFSLNFVRKLFGFFSRNITDMTDEEKKRGAIPIEPSPKTTYNTIKNYYEKTTFSYPAHAKPVGLKPFGFDRISTIDFSISLYPFPCMKRIEAVLPSRPRKCRR